MQAAPCVVTLVHGTWARTADWLEEDSVFRRHLRRMLGPDARFDTFIWSGANRQKERLKAADGLAAQLSRTIAEYPDAAHFIVGHSHGGSVALYALLRGELQARIDGVVCLSTPFIHVRDRTLGTKSQIPLTMAVICGIAIGLSMAQGFGVLWHWPRLSSFWLPAIAGLMVAPFIIHWMLRGTPMFDCELRLRQRIIDRYKLPKPRSDRLLLIRVAADEASAGLAAAQFISRLSSLLAGWPHDLAKRLAVRLARHGEGDALGHQLAGLLAGAIDVLLPTLYFVGGLIAAALIVPVSLLLLPYGADAIFIGPLMDLSIEVAPPGSWRLQQYNPPRRARGLFHSAAYADERVLDAVGRWIGEAAAARLSRDREG